MKSSQYRWRATYTDGMSIEEDKDTSYESIDRSRLWFFDIVHRITDAVALRVAFEPGQRLIWRRRYAQVVGSDKPIVAHIVGKQLTRDGENYQGIFLFFEDDGHTEAFDRFSASHPFLDNVVLLPCETK